MGSNAIRAAWSNLIHKAFMIGFAPYAAAGAGGDSKDLQVQFPGEPSWQARAPLLGS